MTTEVAVLNASAVALAADSAVTTPAGKIYNSALKLFALSETEPVGVMVYGGASLMGLPWETIIKVFRQKLDNQPFDSLQGYFDAFMKFLSRANLFPSESQELWLAERVRYYYGRIHRALVDKIEGTIKHTGSIESNAAENFLMEMTDNFHARLSALPYLDGLNESFDARVGKKYLPRIKTLREKVFQRFSLSSSAQRKLEGIAVMLFSRKISGEGSGIVVAGFGAKELYPSVETNFIRGTIFGHVTKDRMESKSHRILGNADASIISFAQSDMVASFMDGVNPDVRGFLRDHLESMLQQNLAATDPGKVQNLLEEFFQKLDTYTYQEHAQPVMQMVDSLPKDELALMAENLVNLTAFKRRMAREKETVGGPIDVAVISKGDGFEWVKCKPTFQAN